MSKKKNTCWKHFNNEELKIAEKAVSKDKKYGPEQQLIDEFFKKHPKNTDKNIVAAKIAIIDTTNSTNLSHYKSKISLCELADVILKIKDFDGRLQKGDISLVEEIASKTKKNYGINLFSFATKFCCYHNVHVYDRDDFSIFDEVVKTHLKDYQTKELPISINKAETWRINMDYKSFNEYIGKLLDANNITLPNRRRAFDYFVWYKNRDKKKK